MKNNLGEELVNNKIIQAGSATFVASAASELGLATGGIGAITAGKVGVLLATLGPPGLIIGGVLVIGGIAATVYEHYKKQ